MHTMSAEEFQALESSLLLGSVWPLDTLSLYSPHILLPYSSDAGFKSWDVACCVSLSRYTASQSYPRIDSTVKKNQPPLTSVRYYICLLQFETFHSATQNVCSTQNVSSLLALLIKINFHHIKMWTLAHSLHMPTPPLPYMPKAGMFWPPSKFDHNTSLKISSYWIFFEKFPYWFNLWVKQGGSLFTLNKNKPSTLGHVWMMK